SGRAEQPCTRRATDVRELLTCSRGSYSRRMVYRRPGWRTIGGCAVTLLGVTLCTGAAATAEPMAAAIPLYSHGVVVGADGLPRIVPVGNARLHDDAAHLAEQDAWLARGTVPGPPQYADMAERALRDIEALVLPNGAAVAAASPRWRYVWPRDAS